MMDYSDRGLFTDLYQLTMAQGYWTLGLNEKKGTFDLFFRNNPFNGGYAIAAGIGPALDYIERLGFSAEDITFLQAQGIFTDDFLEYLSGFRFTGSVQGLPEGSVVFPHEPILQVTAPMIEAQLLETALLNIVNYSTLIATKASRICAAARGASVIDFGLRRAQGDGAFLGTRAAMIGGCAGTSFVKGGELLGVPISGTQAHSWVQVFESELEAFRAYARMFPRKCLFLIDTYNVLNSGLKNAIQVAKELRDQGNELVGVRIDSGDLAYLAVEVYRAFCDEGFPGITVVLSNELDETLIESIVSQIERPDDPVVADDELQLRKALLSHLMFGVGTRLITGGEQAALGGVYKLVAVDGEPSIKISENVTKIIDPGIKDLFRVKDSCTSTFVADVISFDGEPEPTSGSVIYHPTEPFKTYTIEENISCERLLRSFFDQGTRVSEPGDVDLQTARERCAAQLALLHPTHRRLINPHEYKVSLSPGLNELKQELIKKYTKKGPE
jgi:nicotinate phosphoribosyltransferase